MTALVFLSEGPARDYGALLSRLRWRRAVGADREMTFPSVAVAADAFASGPGFAPDENWVLVGDPAAIPLEARPGGRDGIGSRPLRSRSAVPAGISGSAVHTLRELEASELAGDPDEASGPPAAISFRAVDWPPRAGETLGALFARLAGAAEEEAGGATVGGGGWLRAVAIADPSERPREEILSRVPPGRRRLADVGCGSAATSGELRRRDPGIDVTGFERDPSAAERARRRLDRVLAGDAAGQLRTLGQAGERFDAFVFADVLEHTSDPIAMLAAARAAATDDAIVVASVPNVGHLSLVRDLVLGRFDPVPAGLVDAGHLRWFTKSFLGEALEEAGWDVRRVDALTGAPASDADSFRESLGDWPGLDAASLSTYQWVALAGAGTGSR